VAGGAVREIGMAESNILRPTGQAVTVRTLPDIMVCRALVAHLTILEGGVVDRTLPGAGGVAHRARARFVTVRYRMARLAIC